MVVIVKTVLQKEKLRGLWKGTTPVGVGCFRRLRDLFFLQVICTVFKPVVLDLADEYIRTIMRFNSYI